MKRAAAIVVFIVVCSALVALAQAQDATPPPATPPPSELEPAVDTSGPASETTQAASPPSASQPAPSPREPRASSGARAMDRIELDTTQITGNRELPKVLYIVPWKRSDLGDLVGKPVNSLLDEVLAPVDRDVFRRENRYYGALQPDADSPARDEK